VAQAKQAGLSATRNKSARPGWQGRTGLSGLLVWFVGPFSFVLLLDHMLKLQDGKIKFN
jgi:hypothetical protein